MTPGAQHATSRVVLALSLVIAVVQLALLLNVAAHKANTVDESVYIAAGVDQVRNGNHRINLEHPPLAKYLIGLAVLAYDHDAGRLDGNNVVDSTLWNKPTEELQETLFVARIPIAVLTVLGGLFVFFFLGRLSSPQVALLGQAVYAASPNLLAHGSLATLDAPVTVFLLICAGSLVLAFVEQGPARDPIDRQAERAAGRSPAERGGTAPPARDPIDRQAERAAGRSPAERGGTAPPARDPRWAVVAGVALGCALATKLTALFFLPVLALLGLATERIVALREGEAEEAPASRFGRARRWLLRRRRLELALVLLTGFFTLWLWHGFDFEFHDLTSLQQRYNGPPPPEWLGWLPVPLPFPNYFEGLNWQIGHARTGHSNYLLGEVASTGWWYFFFVAVALKVPHGFQLATLISAGRAVRFHAREWAITGLLLTFPLLFFVYMSFFSTVQNGIKYLLPALPLTYVWTVWVVGKLGRRWKAIAVALLLLGCVESLRVHPDYLMFFNAAAGGPDGGWRYLVHGDDWGQDQNAVGVWQREHDLPLIDFAFYSPKPEKWGIKSRQPTCGPKVGVLVVHVVELVRPDWSPAGCYEWLKGRRPDEKLHYSIFIYRITRDEVLALRAGEAKGRGRLSKWGDPDYVW